MGYAWIITEDHLSTLLADVLPNEPSDVGVKGPRSATDEDLARLDKGEGWVFKMYDDDNELYYTGRLVVSGETDRGDEDAMFGPLTDYGTPNAGAVDIRWAWDGWKSA